MTEENPQFTQFWQAYPRKAAKGYARVAFMRALNKVDFDTLMAGLERYVFASDPRLRPHPATWLNSERWIPETSSEPVTVQVEPNRSRAAWRDKYDGGPPRREDV